MYIEDSIKRHFESKYLTPDMTKPAENPTTKNNSRKKLASMLADLKKMEMLDTVDKRIAEDGKIDDKVKNALVKIIEGDINTDAGILRQLAEAVVDTH